MKKAVLPVYLFFMAAATCDAQKYLVHSAGSSISYYTDTYRKGFYYPDFYDHVKTSDQAKLPDTLGNYHADYQYPSLLYLFTYAKKKFKGDSLGLQASYREWGIEIGFYDNGSSVELQSLSKQGDTQTRVIQTFEERRKEMMFSVNRLFYTAEAAAMRLYAGAGLQLRQSTDVRLSYYYTKSRYIPGYYYPVPVSGSQWYPNEQHYAGKPSTGMNICLLFGARWRILKALSLHLDSRIGMGYNQVWQGKGHLKNQYALGLGLYYNW